MLTQPGKSILPHEHHERASFQNAELWQNAAFKAQRSRQFDILQVKEATFLSVDGCSERASEFSMPGYLLKPGPGCSKAG